VEPVSGQGGSPTLACAIRRSGTTVDPEHNAVRRFVLNRPRLDATHVAFANDVDREACEAVARVSDCQFVNWNGEVLDDDGESGCRTPGLFGAGLVVELNGFLRDPGFAACVNGVPVDPV
jgi:hypothetical protein